MMSRQPSWPSARRFVGRMFGAADRSKTWRKSTLTDLARAYENQGVAREAVSPPHLSH